MRNILAGLAVVCTLVSAPAVDAQTSSSSSSSSPFYFSGILGAEFAQTISYSSTFGIADLTFGLEPVSYGSLPGIGLEFGYWGIGGESTLNDGTFFGALTVDLGGGRLHVGAPRSATDGFSDTPAPGGGLLTEVSIGHGFAAVPRARWYALAVDTTFLGVRYDRTSGPLSYAISARQAEDALLGLMTDFGLGFSRTQGDTRIFGTLDVFRFAPGTRTAAMLGGSMMVGGETATRWPTEIGGSLIYVHNGFGGSFTTAGANLYATAQATDRLSVTAAVSHGFYGGGGNLYGLSMLYDLHDGLMLHGGTSIWSGSDAIMLSLGLRRNL